MVKKDGKKSQILYRITEMRKLSHFEKDPDELELDEADIKKPKIEIVTQISSDLKNGNTSVKLMINFQTPQGAAFLGIESETKFHIKEPAKVLIKDDCNELVFPQELFEYFIGISISGTRGMLAVLNTRPFYKDIILPPVDVKKMVADWHKEKTIDTINP
jgi:hypothetical protein